MTYQKGSEKCRDYNTEKCQPYCDRLKIIKCPYDYRNRSLKKNV